MRLLHWLPGFWKSIRRHPLRTAAAVAALGLLVGVGTYFFRNARAGEHWQAARQAIEEYDFARAQEALHAVLEIQPGSAEAHFLLAQCYRRARRADYDQADTHLATAKRLEWPEKAIAHEYRLLYFQQRGMPDARQVVLQQLLEGPEDPAIDRRLVLEALVRGCLHNDRLEDAAEWLDQWVESYPQDWYAYLWRATLFQHLDRPARAVADYERVLRWKPHSAEVKQRLGLALVHSGSDYEQAVRYLEEYRQSHPDDPDTLVALARCRCVQNQPEAARALLQPVLAADPDHFDALLAMALAEIDLDNYPQALARLRRLEQVAASPRVGETFQRLLRLEPVATNSSVPARLQTVNHLLATVLRRSGHEKEAQVHDKKLKALDADVTALRAALDASGKSPNDPALWYKVGTCFLRVGMKENGERWLGRVLQVNPRDQQAHRALADFYQARPDPESQRKAELHRRFAEGKE
ncbi:MAG: tetratricopeptide repeat protein [Gemmataceae bacterium]|nr:tetratricopeptide repeat protein [Gemmataceae bacterium]